MRFIISYTYLPSFKLVNIHENERIVILFILSLYIVMEFAEYGSLLNQLKIHKQFGEVQSRRWFRQLLDAVAYCHGKGVVHRLDHQKSEI